MRFKLDVHEQDCNIDWPNEIPGYSTFRLQCKKLSELSLDFLKILPPCISKLELKSWFDLSGGDFSNINKMFWHLPETITSLLMYRNQHSFFLEALYNKYSIQLKPHQYSFFALYSFFSNIPPHIHSLELRDINLGKSDGIGNEIMPASHLAQALSAIPPSLTTLKLINANLGEYSADELTQILTTLSFELTKLDLSHNGIYEKSRDELSKIFSAIPANVHTFCFRGSEFYDMGSYSIMSERLKAFSSLPPTLTHLDLSYCPNLSNYLASLFKELPKQISSVALRHNKIGWETNKSLVIAFKAIPENITALDLGYNIFDRKSPTELAKLFAALPSHLLSLCLGGTNLCNLHSEAWFNICRGLPKLLTSLDLSWDDLQSLIPEELTNYFGAIPQTVTTLILKKNNLGAFSEEQLKAFLTAIPGSIKAINLSDNQLHLLSFETLEKLKKKLPQIESLYLSAAEMEAMSVEQHLALREIFPNLRKVFFVDAEGEILGDTPIAQTNLAKKYNFQTNFPSLLELLLTYLPKNTQLNVSTAPIPNELKEQLEDSKLVKIKKSMLSRIQFDEHLKIIKDKVDDMEKKGKKDIHYQEAFLAADTLYTQLEGAKRDFLASPSLSVGVFKKTCLDSIDGATGELKKHRGWKEILTKIASALVSISTLGIRNYMTGRGFFDLFKAKTDSEEQVGNLKNDLDFLSSGEDVNYQDYIETECNTSNKNSDHEKIRESYRS